MRNHYETLGVSRDVSPEDLKKVFRKLSMKYHPDRTNGDAKATDKFKEVNEAYSVLSDPKKRQVYDSPNQFQRGGFSPGFNPFHNFGMNMRSRRPNPNAPTQGIDLKFVAEVPISMFILGGIHSFNISYNDTCQTCNGKGYSTAKTCEECKGAGEIVQSISYQGVQMMTHTTCKDCNGRGEVAQDQCKECVGNGTIRVNRQVEVELPAGSHDNFVNIKRGEGGKGTNGGPQGTLVVKFRMKYPKVEGLTDDQKELLRSI